LDGCFFLPACRHLKETFKGKSRVIPKLDFTGDPLQADWISNYHHIAPYAKVDPRQRKLLLHTRRYGQSPKECNDLIVSLFSVWTFFCSLAEKLY
jgi:hypothetical protein